MKKRKLELKQEKIRLLVSVDMVHGGYETDEELRTQSSATGGVCPCEWSYCLECVPK